MGRDRPRSGNRFYTLATQYIRRQPNVAVVASARSLEEVLDFLGRLPRDHHVETIYLVTHAHRSGQLSFGLTRGAREARFGSRELADAVRARQINLLNAPAVDARTRVVIKGCDVGQDVRMLRQLRGVFGGQVTVVAPRHKQIYIRRGRNVVEGMAQGYWIEYPSRRRMTGAQRQAALAAKYPNVPAGNWRAWMRDRRWTSLIRNQFAFTMQYPDRRAVPRRGRDRAEVIRAQVPDFDEYSWRYQVRRVGRQYHLIATGTKTTYTVERPFRDERGNLRQFPLTDRAAYGVFPVPAQRPARPVLQHAR